MEKYKTRHFWTFFGQMFYNCFTTQKIDGKTKQKDKYGETPVQPTIGDVSGCLR
jgi:hypothetical protein